MRFEARNRTKGAGRLANRLVLIALALAVALTTLAGDAEAKKKKKVKAPPGTILFERKSETDKKYPPAYFPHWVHEIRYRCYVCHPAVFVMKKGANDLTKETMRKGESCGKCHNGRFAFEIGLQTCSRCHQKPK